MNPHPKSSPSALMRAVELGYMKNASCSQAILAASVYNVSVCRVFKIPFVFLALLFLLNRSSYSRSFDAENCERGERSRRLSQFSPLVHSMGGVYISSVAWSISRHCLLQSILRPSFLAISRNLKPLLQQVQHHHMRFSVRHIAAHTQFPGIIFVVPYLSFDCRDLSDVSDCHSSFLFSNHFFH